MNKQELQTIKLATFNIAAGNYSSVDALHQLISQRSNDIVGLQEVDLYTKRNPLSMVTEIAGTDYPNRKFSSAMPFEGGDYGNGLLSKWPLIDYKELRYSMYGLEPRTAQFAKVELGNNRVITLCNTHLSFESIEIRTAQVAELLDEMAEFGGEYKVIMGDFNMDQTKEEWQPFLAEYKLANGQQDGWFETFQEKEPLMKSYSIDNIIVSKNIELIKTTCVKNTLSDHALFEVEIKLGKGE
ncbi:hypothetical protein IGI37_003538 [Enterococcus sp. AZ194]|uniref:endonuclease/exonuclease/phosphatase family protein n=1 Tax=Enterococcus sp. AZ194 TaxID=2774629 RepID=UPI003F292DDE